MNNTVLLNEIKSLKELITNKYIDVANNNNKGVKKLPYVKEGTIFLHNGYYEARITLNGKQIYVCSSKIQKIAIKKLRQAVELKKQGKLNELIKSITFYEWLNKWLETYKKPFTTERTFKSIVNIIENHIKTNIEDKDLNKINSIELQQCLNNITMSRTKESVHSVLKGTFEKAFKLKIINSNPIDLIEYKKHRRKNRNALTKEQQAEFLKVIKNSRFKNLFLFYLYTGARKAEPLLSEWTDFKELENLFIIRGSKTETSLFRPIPLYNDLKNLLIEIRNNQKEKSNKIFTMSVTAIQKEVVKIKLKLSFDFSLHMLRHTFTTNCIEKGVNIKAVQKWLGHKDLSTTEKVYTHISTEFEKNESLKLD
jgi:integrase